ncbi:phage tail tube protein [Paracoccus laeviglucosivorans]|uniref:Phage tail tube protein n=1 Tax=Paracoccus laeviglucosivorans TaxID=1197861 RepID=A0A521E4E7_9RHOB|nr:phage tail tube protein [Paracoccus laeviglucosivorans]SMO78745.1 Phage tail tube protein [Paracoccus laeviglucosivorans]
MAAPITERFEQMTLEVATNEGGTEWTKLCGLVGVTITRTATWDTSEVPADCDDESQPMRQERDFRSLQVSISADGVWAQQSNDIMLDWFYNGERKLIRLGHQNAAVAATQYERGPAIMTTLTNQRTKGQKVTASIQLEFDGTPTRIARAA